MLGLILRLNLMLGSGSVGDKLKAWILNDDITPQAGVVYVWDDNGEWFDDNLWKD